MRKTLSIFAVVAIAAITLVSCNKKEDPNAPFELSTNELEFSNEGGALTVDVTTTAKWSVATVEDWITITEERNPGKATVTVTVSKNEAPAGECAPERSGKISFTHGAKVDEVTVTQSAEKVMFSVDVASFELPKEGGTVKVKVTSNYPYSVTSTPDWIQASTETKAASTGEITLVAAANDITIERSGDVVIATNKGRELTVTITEQPTDVMYGEGTQEKPYRVYVVADLPQLREKLTGQVAGETAYIELCQDIDMASIENWEPLRQYYTGDTKPYVFDGLNHTISNLKSAGYNYSSFFGFVIGTVKDVTFKNAKISCLEGSSSRAGVIAGLAGDTGKKFTATNVHAQDCEVSTTVSRLHMGGLCGAIENADLEYCSFTGKVIEDGPASNYAGGLVGYSYASSTISSCWTDAAIILGTEGSSTFSGVHSYIGGIQGNGTAVIKDCYSLGDITTTGYIKLVGGISGYLPGGSITNCYSTSAIEAHNCAGGICSKGDSYDYSVKGCIAWNKSIKSKNASGQYCFQDDADYYSAAFVFGFANSTTLTDNYRRPDATFEFYASGFGGHSEINYNDLFDQENVSASAPLVVPTKYALPGTNFYPYHGKAAAAGSTVSSVAKTLGWDTAVWDLSKDYPTLKKK